MSGERILAIDNGTQSVRAMIFDLQGSLVAKARVPIEPYTSSQPGWAEQDPAVFWQAVCTACQQLWLVAGVDKSSIAGVTLTTQRSTLVNVDEKGQPLRPAIHWLDSAAHTRSQTGRRIVGIAVRAQRHEGDSRIPAGRS